MELKDVFAQDVALCLQDALRAGVVLTVEVRPQHPPRMGAYDLVIHQRPVNPNHVATIRVEQAGTPE